MKASVPAQAPDLAQVQATALSARPDLRRRFASNRRAPERICGFRSLRARSTTRPALSTVASRASTAPGIRLAFFERAAPDFQSKPGRDRARRTSEDVQLGKNLEVLQSQIIGEVVQAYREYDAARQMISEIERDLLGPSQEARDTTAYVYKLERVH